MFITLAVLLLLLFALGFWIVTDSKVSTFVKVGAISLFFFFCVVLAASLDSSMGWAAPGKRMPEIVTLRHIIIKEPNEQLKIEGSIYFLIDANPDLGHENVVLSLFSYKPGSVEPRLFRIPYSRSLHEQLQKSVIPRLMKGQTVTGKLTKGGKGDKGGNGNIGGNGEGEGENDGEGDGNGHGHGRGNERNSGNSGNRGMNGGGSESLNTDFQFYELPPSYYLPKN